jgi:uncharacterized membrane protein YphA (DoxX/SURF4 family)/peroxiredoxin
MPLPLRTVKRSLAFIVSMAIGLFFIYSAYSKIPTLEQFGWRITETTFLNWTMSEWVARIIIGMEFFVGVLFLFHLRLKRLGIPLAMTMLVVFSSYLVYVAYIRKENVDCGCMGEVLRLTPLQSLIKNGVLIGLLLLLRSIRFSWTFERVKPVLWVSLIVCLLVPFIMSAPESIYIHPEAKTIRKPIPLSLLYTSTANQAPSIELRKGKHVLVFLSLSCTYCKKAAQRFRVMKAKYPELPVYAIMNGSPSELKGFIAETRMDNVPYTLFNGADDFSAMNGSTSLPTVKFVSDTTVVREVNYITVTENDILTWLADK